MIFLLTKSLGKSSDTHARIKRVETALLKKRESAIVCVSKALTQTDESSAE